MKTILAVCLAILPLSAFGDAYMNQGKGSCHVPFDPNGNTNYEYKFNPCEVSGFQIYGQYQRAWAKKYLYNIGKNYLPESLHVPFNPNEVTCAKVQVENVGACSFITDEGDTFATNRWISTVQACTAHAADRYDVSFGVSCRGAQKQ